MSRRLCLFALHLSCVFCSASVVNAATRVALVSTCGGDAAGDVLALAEAKLSTAERMVLVERKEVDRILEEQKLQTCGLSQAEQAIAVGKLLGAEVFAALETFPHSKEALGLVAFDASTGVRLWDAALPAGGPEKTADGVVAAVCAACEKRQRPVKEQRTICLLSVRNADLPREMDSLCESVGQILERRLLGSTSLSVLERQRLEQVNREREMPTATPLGELLPSLTLVELEIGRGEGGQGIEASAFLTDAAGKELGRASASTEQQDGANLAEALVREVTIALKAAPAIGVVDRAREAERFWHEAKFLDEHSEFERALQAAEAAYALGPDKVKLRPLLAWYIAVNGKELLYPGGPIHYDHTSRPTLRAANLNQSLRLEMRAMDLCIQIRDETHAEENVTWEIPTPNSVDHFQPEALIFYFLQAEAGHPEGYDDESRVLLKTLRAKFLGLKLELLRRAEATAGNSPNDFHSYCKKFQAYKGAIDVSTSTWAEWASEISEVYGQWLRLVTKFPPCDDPKHTIIDIMFPVVSEAGITNVFFGKSGWRSKETKQLGRLFERWGQNADPLIRAYGMAGKLTIEVRGENQLSEDGTRLHGAIQQLARATIVAPPCEPAAGYRLAAYQAALDAIDLLPDRAARRREHQALFDFMVQRRELAYWVMFAAVDPDAVEFAAHHFRGLRNGLYWEDAEPRRQDYPALLQNLNRVEKLVELPDYCALNADVRSDKGSLAEELAAIRRRILVERPDLAPPSPVPWTDAMFLLNTRALPAMVKQGKLEILDEADKATLLAPNGRFSLAQLRVVGDSVYAVGCLTSMDRGSQKYLQVLRVPLDGRPAVPVGRALYDSYWLLADFHPRLAVPGACHYNGKFYAGTAGSGIYVFPTDGGSVEHLDKGNGLPSNYLHALACCDGKLYAGCGQRSQPVDLSGKESYLVAYDLQTDQCRVIISTRRRDKRTALDDTSPPFHVRNMWADPTRHRVLFTLDVGTLASGSPSFVGLWELDTRTESPRQLLALDGACEWMGYDGQGRDLIAVRNWRGDRYEVISFAPDTNKAHLVGTDDRHRTGRPIPVEDPVFQIPFRTYPPHVILGDWLWSARPFGRVSLDGKKFELFPNLVGDNADEDRMWLCLEPIDGGKQLLVGHRDGLWLLTLPEKPAKD